MLAVSGLRYSITSMKSKSAFTIVEVLVVIVIISILSSIAVVAYNNVQRDSRDSTRKGNATVISNALEKYYNINGEYPSVRSLVNSYPENTGTLVADKLKISPSDLLMPKMPPGSTNSLAPGPTPQNDYITYVGSSSVNNNDCQSLVAGGCDQFILQYVKESGSTETINSIHK